MKVNFEYESVRPYGHKWQRTGLLSRTYGSLCYLGRDEPYLGAHVMKWQRCIMNAIRERDQSNHWPGLKQDHVHAIPTPKRVLVGLLGNKDIGPHTGLEQDISLGNM